MRLQTGIELGENGSNFPRPKGKPHMGGCAISGLVIAPSSQWAAWQVSGPERCEPRPRCASGIRGEPLTLPWSRTRQGREELGEEWRRHPPVRGKPRAAS